MGLVYEMRIEDAVQKQNITELAHSPSLTRSISAMEVVLVDAIDEDVLGIASEEEERYGTQPHLAIDSTLVEGSARE